MKGIGYMRHRITIQVRTQVTEPGGGLSETWAADMTVSADGTTWAAVTPLTSKRMAVSDKVVITEGYQIILRWATGRIMDKTRRVIYNGQTLTISGVKVIDEAKRFYQVTCLTNT